LRDEIMQAAGGPELRPLRVGLRHSLQQGVEIGKKDCIL